MSPKAHFFEKIGRLKIAMARHDDARTTVADMADLLHDDDVRREFFSLLDRPDWVAPLREAGFFDEPPLPQISEGAERVPVWPESRFLVRMAKHVPEDVAAILESVDTSNVFVVGDIISAGLEMPASVTAMLVPTLVRAAGQGTLWLHYGEASALCAHLAEGGQVGEALDLADTLFVPVRGADEVPLAARDNHWVKVGIKRVLPTLVEQAPLEILTRLSTWLETAVSVRRYADRESGSDNSGIWRPAIEEHEQNRDYELAAVMVGLVRAGFEEAISDGRVTLKQALDLLNRHPYLIFRRIRIHLINEFADRHPELARRTMLDRQLFEDPEYKHEYAMMVGRRLNLLTSDERDTWFGWLEEGPGMLRFRKSIRNRFGRDPTTEERKSRKDYWQFEKLHCVREYLEGTWRTFYEGMLASHGEPMLADLNSRISSAWRGTDSPMAVEDLAGLSFEQVAEKVSSWQPSPDDPGGPDVEGLADTFGQYITERVAEVSTQARVMIGRPRIYVGRYIREMAEGVKSEAGVEVGPVMDLCQWVLTASPRRGAAGEPNTSLANEWQTVRDEMSRFIESVCQARRDGDPVYPLDGLREQLWSAIVDLATDSPESYILPDGTESDPRLQDYLTSGINSPRGKAVEAALEYGRWVGSHKRIIDGGTEILPEGFGAMPELQRFLEGEIAQSNRTVGALAVIGSRIGLLYWIDKDWLGANADRLFQLDSAGLPPSADGWAVWNAFLMWVGPHIEYYRLFKTQYALSVEEAASVVLTERDRGNPMSRLGEHLMVLYGRGQLSLDDDDGLLRRFVRKSNPEVRRGTIEFAGRVVSGDEEVPNEVVLRFKTLWDFYWEGPGKKDARGRPDMWSFGLWFSSGRFPVQWALERLDSFTRENPTPEPTQAVVKELARVAESDEIRAVRILDRMVRGDTTGWWTQEWLDAAGRVLEVAMRAGGDARSIAEEVVEHLGRRGHMQFGTLLAAWE